MGARTRDGSLRESEDGDGGNNTSRSARARIETRKRGRTGHEAIIHKVGVGSTVERDRGTRVQDQKVRPKKAGKGIYMMAAT